jgi:hypothetical protein
MKTPREKFFQLSRANGLTGAAALSVSDTLKILLDQSVAVHRRAILPGVQVIKVLFRQSLSKAEFKNCVTSVRPIIFIIGRKIKCLK